MAGAVFRSQLFGFKYTVTRKKIKSVNLRVKQDGSVSVSAPYGVPDKFILDFVEKNSARIAEIIGSLPSPAERKPEKSYSEAEEFDFLLKAEAVCRLIEPLFFDGKYEKPRIELCRGRSRWGYCMPRKRTVRLNIKLSEYPEECLRYVAMHEYCHFLVPNHSTLFYRELEKRMPDWKRYKEMLGEHLE